MALMQPCVFSSSSVPGTEPALRVQRSVLRQDQPHTSQYGHYYNGDGAGAAAPAGRRQALLETEGWS